MSLLLIIATACAFYIKGMCGFANTLVFTTIAGFQYDNVNISPVELILGYPSNVIIAWKERKNADIKIWMPLVLLVILGSIPGIFFLKNGSSKNIKVLFGIVVVCIGIEMLFREYHKKRKTSKLLLGAIGLLSGLFCGLYGIGALLAAYVSRTAENNGSFKCNLCIVFIIENTFRIVMYIVLGIINKEVFTKAMILMPFMLAGLSCGMVSAKFLPEKVVRKLVIIMLIISGVALVNANIR